MLLWTRMTNDETGTPPFNRWFAGIAALHQACKTNFMFMAEAHLTKVDLPGFVINLCLYALSLLSNRLIEL